MKFAQSYPNSLQPHGLYSPWNSPGQNTGVWVAFSFSRVSSQPRDRTQVPCITGRFFTSWTPREALWSIISSPKHEFSQLMANGLILLLRLDAFAVFLDHYLMRVATWICLWLEHKMHWRKPLMCAVNVSISIWLQHYNLKRRLFLIFSYLSRNMSYTKSCCLVRNLCKSLQV